MTTIETDNPAIEKCLNTLIDLVEEGEGGFHSKLVIQSFDGDLNISTSEPLAGKEIIRLSKKVLLPSEKYEIEVRGDEFSVSFVESGGFSDLQQRLVTCMAALYNETNKAALFKKYSFLLSMAPYPSLVEYLQQGRDVPPGKLEWISKLKDDPSDDVIDNFVSDVFLQTRHLGYEDVSRMKRSRILMPVVDFLNHNWTGSSFSTNHGVRSGDLTVKCSQPIENNLECFAFYGAMDAMDTLIRYDFPDAGAPVVRSVPITLEVPGHGNIKINSLTGGMNMKKLANEFADLHLYIPIVSFDEDEKELSASHIFIPALRSKRALNRVLSYLLINFFQSMRAELDREFAARWIEQACHEILQKNIEYYEQMQIMIDQLIKSEGASFGLESIKGLADLQLNKLHQYEHIALDAGTD